jgi:hypothetical protein
LLLESTDGFLTMLHRIGTNHPGQGDLCIGAPWSYLSPLTVSPQIALLRTVAKMDQKL